MSQVLELKTVSFVSISETEIAYLFFVFGIEQVEVFVSDKYGKSFYSSNWKVCKITSSGKQTLQTRPI